MSFYGLSSLLTFTALKRPQCLSQLCFALLQWQEVGDTAIDTGANPSAEEADEGVDSSSRKVVDIIDGFRLVVRPR